MLAAFALLAWLPTAAPAAETDWRDIIASQAADHGWEPLDKPFAVETVAALSRLATTREHIRFVKRHGIDLRVVPPGEKVPATALGSFVESDRAMYINQDFLLRGADELRRQGAPRDAAAEILAWKFLPTVVHEIRHAMTRARLRERTGFTVRLNPLESEYISFLDSVRVLREEVKVRPGLWKDASRILEVERTNALTVDALGRGVPSLKELVRGVYEGKPSLLETPREKLVEEYRRRKKEVHDAADKLLRIDEGAVEDAEVRADLEETALSVAEAIVLYREMLRVVEDPRAHAKLSRFYESELEAMVRAVEKRD